jgi:hypothetical protein
MYVCCMLHVACNNLLFSIFIAFCTFVQIVKSECKLTGVFIFIFGQRCLLLIFYPISNGMEIDLVRKKGQLLVCLTSRSRTEEPKKIKIAPTVHSPSGGGDFT